MSTTTSEPVIVFPDGYEERGQYEAPARGYLSDVIVHVEDGSRYQLFFYDPVRLEQDLTSEGRGYLAELNMIILTEVNTENIRNTVQALWREGYFLQIKPLQSKITRRSIAMSRTSTPRVAILGAGPIGLEAGLAARQLKVPFAIYERGRVGEHLLRWGHVRLFSPFSMNATTLGRSTIAAAKPAHTLPADDACITGREHVERYLAPLGETLKEHLRTDTQVLRTGRRNCLKSDDPGDSVRARHPFLLLVREKNQERIEEADVVLDCTGVYGQHRWLGDGGVPALGEVQAEPHIGYALEDVLGARRNDYAGKSVLVVGGGYSAATTVVSLATLAEQDNSTWVTWIARAPHSQPLRRISGDPLRERDRLAVRANNLATRGDGNVEFHAATVVEAIESHGQGRGFRVTTRSGSSKRTAEYDAVIGNVGYTPDTNLYRELQVHECYATLGPIKLAAALLGQKTTDCLKVVTPGPDALRNPEPNFYILGAKSYGRSSQFLLRNGLEQVQAVFELIKKDFRF